MNVVVVGLGSMGKRRIRLIRELFPEYVIIGVDSREDRRSEASSLYGIKCCESLDELVSEVQCAFVCTSPLSHAAIIKTCLTKKWNVFTELNLVEDRYDENMKLAKENGCKLFLSSTFFYREEIRYIRSKIDKEQKWNYIYHVGQYLPDLHPWENYKDFFVGNVRTNGCREILAIELPWLTGTFGKVKDLSVLSDLMTSLNISYNDNFLIQVEHENGNKGMLIADVVSPVAVRKLEVYTEGSYYSWDGTPESLKEFNPDTKKLEFVKLTEQTEHETGYSTFIVENAYKNEILEFFAVVLENKEPLYGFEQDKNTLALIQRIGA